MQICLAEMKWPPMLRSAFFVACMFAGSAFAAQTAESDCAAEAGAATPGQDPFSEAIPTSDAEIGVVVQRVFCILKKDPQTDWDTVDLPALRRHLSDMAELARRGRADVETVDGGIRATVSGTGDTVARSSGSSPPKRANWHGRATMPARSRRPPTASS